MNLTIAEDMRIRDRRRAIPFFCGYHLGFKQGRRTQERRSDTVRGSTVYVDRYASHLLLCIVGILILNICDILFTLRILAYGGEELNWFMAVLINESIGKFVAVKMALTSLAVIMLVIHHHVRIGYSIRIKHILFTVLAGYSILISYELYLLELAAGL